MKHSESIAKLATALVKAQAEVQHATKDAKNPHFRSGYASLESVIDTVKPVFAAHGLAVVQFPGLDADGASVESVVLHESGEWISGVAASPMTKQDPQGVGSALTYLRRYSLVSLAGIAQADDDGNAASRPAERTHHEQPSANNHTDHAPEGDMIDCPACGGSMYDNRATKKGKQPDLKCKSKECDHAIWLDGWQKSLREEIETVHMDGFIDAAQRSAADEIVASGNPKKMQHLTKRLAEVKANGTPMGAGAGA
ncbi:MAG: ERF family protein [Vicinamibacterales bacterium]